MLIINACIPQTHDFSPETCVRLHDGTLAGSVLTMRQALHGLIHRFGIAPIDAVRMCTATPAESVGERNAGHMVPGSPAPLTRCSKDWKLTDIVEER